MGAFVGALYAGGATADDLAECCRQELVERRPFADYTLSRTGLIRGRRARAMLGRVFGSRRIETLSRAFFCVSADLLEAELVLHRSGAIAEAVGASMALPGLVAPRRIGGRLLVDGGVLDNLPIGAMADMGEGPVLASDVMGRRLSAEDAGAASGRVPSVIETVARATTLGSWRNVRSAERRAALVIRPALPATD